MPENNTKVHYHLSANVKFDKENAFNGSRTSPNPNDEYCNPNIENSVYINDSNNRKFINSNNNNPTIIEKFNNIINNNRYNQNPKVYSCNQCKCVSALTGSYIAFVEEDEFLSNPKKYIDNAYDKSEKDAEGYNLTKQR